MEVNAFINPTKMLPFSKSPMITKEWMFLFFLNVHVIENVKDFKYFRIIFSRSVSFQKAKTHRCEKA